MTADSVFQYARMQAALVSANTPSTSRPSLPLLSCIPTSPHQISLIDYIAISGTMDVQVLEYVNHLHEHFVAPCEVDGRARYKVPLGPNIGYR